MKLVPLCIVIGLVASGVWAEDEAPMKREDFKVAEMQRDIPIPPRKMEAVKKIVSDFSAPKKAKPLHIIFAAGPKTHGVNAHDYPFFQKRYTQLLSFGKNVTVDSSWIFPSDDQYKKADIVVFNSMMQDITPEHSKRLNKFITRGGGVVYVHIGVQAQKCEVEQIPNVGLVWAGGCRYRHGPVDLDFTAATHAITKGFENVHFHDESYWKLKGDPKSITVLATSLEKDKKESDAIPQPQIWTKDVGKGRIVANILGHYSWTYDDPMFRILFLRSLAWVTDDDLTRFNDLILLGARVE
jgi:type 1 glutamine amidotransferase